MMPRNLNTMHGNLHLPAFFPTIGWPAGNGEYDNLFNNLEYFCTKLQHRHFLFNFGSFIFGYSIPSAAVHNDYSRKYANIDIRKIIQNEYKCVPDSIASQLIILLDIGGNRIFNKVVSSGLAVERFSSYELYLEKYIEFCESSNSDIVVGFEVAPSYTTKDDISKAGVAAWNHLSHVAKHRLNNVLMEKFLSKKPRHTKVMVPISAANLDGFRQKLLSLYTDFGDEISIVGIGGIANEGLDHVAEALQSFNAIKNEKNWNVISHGLGLGGKTNIPLLSQYGINTCDVASPWRRACTDIVSNVYIPLLDKDLEFTSHRDPLNNKKLYDESFIRFRCECPICVDMSLKDVREQCLAADKRTTGDRLHRPGFREMRIRVYMHNVFQHIALVEKLSQLKAQHGDDYLQIFYNSLQPGKFKRKMKKMIES